MPGRCRRASSSPNPSANSVGGEEEGDPPTVAIRVPRPVRPALVALGAALALPPATATPPATRAPRGSPGRQAHHRLGPEAARPARGGQHPARREVQPRPHRLPRPRLAASTAHTPWPPAPRTSRPATRSPASSRPSTRAAAFDGWRAAREQQRQQLPRPARHHQAALEPRRQRRHRGRHGAHEPNAAATAADTALTTARAQRDALGKQKTKVANQITKYRNLLATLNSAARAAFLRAQNPSVSTVGAEDHRGQGPDGRGPAGGAVRAGPGRQALRVRCRRPGRVRLLRPDDDGVEGRRDAAALGRRPVQLRPPRVPRPAQAGRPDLLLPADRARHDLHRQRADGLGARPRASRSWSSRWTRSTPTTQVPLTSAEVADPGPCDRTARCAPRRPRRWPGGAPLSPDSLAPCSGRHGGTSPAPVVR